MLQSMGSQSVGHDRATEQQLIYNVGLVSGVQQSDSVRQAHVSIFQILFSFRFLQNIE